VASDPAIPALTDSRSSWPETNSGSLTRSSTRHISTRGSTAAGPASNTARMSPLSWPTVIDGGTIDLTRSATTVATASAVL
jgi:hypothetical protein